MKLVCLGDSLTQGTYGGSYMEVLRALRPADEIINAGRSGDTVLNLLTRVDEVLAHAPDGVFVMIGGNDAISFSQPATRPFYRRAKALPDGMVTPEQFSAGYRDLLTQLQLGGALVWVGLPPAEANPTASAALAHFNALARQAAGSWRIPVLDLMAHFAPLPPPERPPLDMDTIITIGQREKNGWRDYEASAQAGGYHFTFDGLHLLPGAAARMAALISAFVDS